MRKRSDVSWRFYVTEILLSAIALGSEAPGRLASGKAPAVVLRLHSRQRSARTNLRSAFSDVEN